MPGTCNERLSLLRSFTHGKFREYSITQAALSTEQQTIVFYTMAFLNSECSLAKSHVDSSQYQCGNFPTLFC